MLSRFVSLAGLSAYCLLPTAYSLLILSQLVAVARMPLEELIKKVASQFNVQEESILSASRKRNVSDARGIICSLAVNDFGYSTAEVGRALGMRRVSAGQCVDRGNKMLDKELDLRVKLSLN